MFCFWLLDLDLTVGNKPGGTPAAVRPEWSSRGGAMEGNAGVLGSLAPEHQNAKEQRLGVEKLTGVSLGVVCRAEEQGAGLAACGRTRSVSARSKCRCCDESRWFSWCIDGKGVRGRS
jgi:hypothetical protein